MVFVARCEPSEMFDAIEEPLDAVTRTLEHRAEAGLPAAADHRLNIGGGAGGFDLSAQPIGIVSLVAAEGSRTADRLCKNVRNCVLTAVCWRRLDEAWTGAAIIRACWTCFVI